MASDMVRIYSINNLYVAELVKQMLIDHNIQSFIVNKQDSAYKFGEIELFVHRDHIMKAKMLIREFETD
jgi:hypothetical protein